MTKAMDEFNIWMLEHYGYSWYQHLRNLKQEGHSEEDINDELIGLAFVWCNLTAFRECHIDWLVEQVEKQQKELKIINNLYEMLKKDHDYLISDFVKLQDERGVIREQG